MSLEYRRAPLGLGGKGDPAGADPVGFPGKHLRHGPAGIVFRLAAEIDGRQHRLQPLGRILRQRNHILHLHHRLGDGTGFVHTQNIHPGQCFDAVHILHQHLSPGQHQSRCRHGHTGQQIQALGDHAHQRCHRSLHAVPEGQLQHLKFLEKQQKAHRYQRDANYPDQPVQRTHHAGFCRMGISLGLRGQPGRIGIHAHLGQPHPAGAGHHKAAGTQGISGQLLYRILFAGDQRFIQQQPAGAYHTVCADLIPGSKLHDIVPNQQIRPDRFPVSFPQGAQLLGSHQGQLVHRPLGPDLLITADGDVAHHHDQKGHILHGGTGDDQQCRQHHKHQIEEGQQVFRKNLPLRAGSTLGDAVGPAGCLAKSCFLPAESHLGIRFQNRHFLSDDRFFFCFTQHDKTLLWSISLLLR